ncbi:MAG: phosphatase PAP2 family protein [Clostridia bacterium]|nr:phosphatase PAP2 family protein [Clostridia bacterium]
MLENDVKQVNKRKMIRNALLIIIGGLVVWALDFNILFWIQNFIRNDVFDVIIPFYTSLGEDGIIWIVLGLILLIPKKYRKTGIMVLGALVVMLVVNNIVLKNLIARPRPCWTYPEMVQLVHNPSSYSFPSGHTTSAFAVAFTVFSQHKRLGKLIIVMASVMAFTRLYVFVHFPTDIYGGILVAMAITTFVCFMEKKISPKVDEIIQNIKAKKA